MKSAQEWIHWLEAGAGSLWVRRAAFVSGALVLSLVVGWKQFRGARSEVTLAQADLGWQLGTGNGFTTRVKSPQTAAWLVARGEKFAVRAAFPSLDTPPLYPLVIGGAVAALPAAWREKMFFPAPSSAAPDGSGFGGDYLLLAVNVALLWLAAWLTHALARRLFDARVALVAVLALLLSAGVWAETVTVNGTPLAMVLLLSLALSLARADEVATANLADAGNTAARRAWPWWAAAGMAAGLMFLTDYPAGVAVFVVLGAAVVSPGGGRGKNFAAAALAFAIVVAPWVTRNVALTASPVGLAWHDVALRAGDPTAEPATVRAIFSAAAPEFSLNKLGNKGLAAVQAALRERLWAGGGIFLTAFFVTGLLYRFRGDTARRLRWAVVALLGALVVAHAFLGSGEGERQPAAYAAPLLIVFGAGFFSVLVASDGRLAARAGWAAAGLLALQAAPLAHDALEPRRAHFNYPPYYPGAFQELRTELVKRGAATGAVWMCDVPAGAAWYGGGAVWAQPAALQDFYRLAADEPPVALLLTPHALNRPFWEELTAVARVPDPQRGSWAQVNGALAGAWAFPPVFPLTQRVALPSGFLALFNPVSPKAR